MAVTILGNSVTPVTGTRTFSPISRDYTFSNGVTMSDNTVTSSLTFGNGITLLVEAVSLGGTLTAHTTISGSAGSYDFLVNNTRNATLYANTQATIGCAGGDDKSISISTSAMTVTDVNNEIGLQYAADYSSAGGSLGARWIPDKGYVDNSIAAISDVRVARARIQYTDYGTPITVVSLDASDVVWDIKLQVITVFNDPTSNGLIMGKTGNTDYYTGDATDLSVLESTGWTDYTDNIPDTMSGATDITVQYIAGEDDPSTGDAYVYVRYTKF